MIQNGKKKGPAAQSIGDIHTVYLEEEVWANEFIHQCCTYLYIPICKEEYSCRQIYGEI